MKHKSNILIIVTLLILIVVGLALGYASLSKILTINGSTTIEKWNVEIIDIKESLAEEAKNKTTPTYTKTTASFNVELTSKKDKATYTITIKNKGNVDAKLEKIDLAPITSNYEKSQITYSIESQPAINSILKAGDTTTVVVKIEFDQALTDDQIKDLTKEEKVKKVSTNIKYKKVSNS